MGYLLALIFQTFPTVNTSGKAEYTVLKCENNVSLKEQYNVCNSNVLLLDVRYVL